MARKGRRNGVPSLKRSPGSSMSMADLQHELHQTQRADYNIGKMVIGREVKAEPFVTLRDTLVADAKSRGHAISKWIAPTILRYVLPHEMPGLVSSIGGPEMLGNLLTALQTEHDRLAPTMRPMTVSPRYAGFLIDNSRVSDRSTTGIRVQVNVSRSLEREVRAVRSFLDLPDRTTPGRIFVPLARLAGEYDKQMDEVVQTSREHMPPSAEFLPLDIHSLPNPHS